MVGGNFQHRMEGAEWDLGIPHFKAESDPPAPGAEGLSFASMGEGLGRVYLETDSAAS